MILFCAHRPHRQRPGRGPLKAKTRIRIPWGHLINGSRNLCFLFVKFTMSKETKYPRYRFRRTIINSIGRGLLRLLAKVKIEALRTSPKGLLSLVATMLTT